MILNWNQFSKIIIHVSEFASQVIIIQIMPTWVYITKSIWKSFPIKCTTNIIGGGPNVSRMLKEYWCDVRWKIMFLSFRNINKINIFADDKIIIFTTVVGLLIYILFIHIYFKADKLSVSIHINPWHINELIYFNPLWPRWTN